MVQMIIIQSILFVIPSIVLGYAGSIPTLKYLYGFMFKNQTGVQLSIIPTAKSTIRAVALGLLIPLVSSLVPIRIALSKNLNDSLDANRSKTKGTIVTITESNRPELFSYLLYGSIGVIAGIAIYYLLPLAVLNFNLGLILEIFFFILLGMILGLTLISLNFQRIVELTIVYIFLFFERKSMKLMILKNLVSHRESNKLTAIIFSLTLGSIIFVVVAANLQI